jgi:acyl-CoA dehydrogenase
VDISLSAEQQRCRAWAREFADTHVRPVVADLDRLNDPLDRFPWAILEKAHEEGLLRFGLPEAFGGAPPDEIASCLVMEELGAADVGVAAIVAQYWNATQLIDRWGNDYHRDNFIKPYVEDPRTVYAVAMTEAHAGIDAHLPYDEPRRGRCSPRSPRATRSSSTAPSATSAAATSPTSSSSLHVPTGPWG